MRNHYGKTFIFKAIDQIHCFTNMRSGYAIQL